MSKDHVPQTTGLELWEVGKREFGRRVDVLDVEDGDGWRHIDRHDGSKLRVSRVNSMDSRDACIKQRLEMRSCAIVRC